MKTVESITKAAPGAPRKQGRGLRALIVLALLGAAGGAALYYWKHRPTSEAEILEIEALIKAGQEEKARERMTDAQVRARDVDALRLRIGRAYLREGFAGPATALLSKVEPQLGKEERLMVAEYFRAAGDPFSAVRFYEAAFKTGVARTPALTGRYGEALALSGNNEAAVTVFRETLALDETQTLTRLNLALTLANLDRLEESRIEAEAVLRVDPQNQKAINLLMALPPPPPGR